MIPVASAKHFHEGCGIGCAVPCRGAAHLDEMTISRTPPSKLEPQ